MKELKFEIKGITTFEGNEGFGLVCDLYINGTKCYHCVDNADGGEMNFHQISNNENVKNLIKQLNEYCKNQPKIKYCEAEFPYTIENLIDELYNQKEIEKAKKKMLKLQETAIIIGQKNNYYDYKYIKQKQPLTTFPEPLLQNFIDKIKKTLVGNEVILNTNLTKFNIE